MRNQIAAAARAGINAATINSTNIEDWAQTYAAVNRGRDRRAAALARAAEQPRLPRQRHAAAGGDLRAAGRRRGALHQRLGPRLPARLPPAAHPAARAAGRHPGAGDHRDRQRPRGGRRRRGARARSGTPTCSSCAARSTANRCASACSRCPRPPHRLAWLADHLAALPGSGIIYTLTVAGSQQVADYLRGRGFAVAAYSGQTEPAERLVAEDDLINNRVKALVATSALGMGFDKPDLGFVIHFGAPLVADLLLPAGRTRRARRRERRGDPAARAPRTRRSGPTSPRPASRPSGRCGPPWPHWTTPAARSARPPSRPRSSCRGRGSRRCSRCSTSTARCSGSAAAGWRPASPGPTTPSATPGSPRCAPPSSRPCATTSRPSAAACGSCASSSTIRAPPTAAAATTAAA